MVALVRWNERRRIHRVYHVFANSPTGDVRRFGLLFLFAIYCSLFFINMKSRKILLYFILSSQIYRVVNEKWMHETNGTLQNNEYSFSFSSNQ